MNPRTSICLILIALPMMALSMQAYGYDGKLHQQLTFVAAKHFNQCAAQADLPLLTALEVRYMARSNVAQAGKNIFTRLFLWDYYDREDEAEQSFFWVVETRFHEHFNEVVDSMKQSDDSVQAYQDLGIVLGYLQLVTSPAHVVPVHTARYWRLSFSDRFDSYPVDEEALMISLGDDCGFISSNIEEYSKLLSTAAADTLRAVVQPIPGLPISWQAFWRFGDKPGEFGEYGVAGNMFGRKTDFRCGEEQRCVLLDDDPLYAGFALARHLQAVRSTLLAMRIMQTSNAAALVVPDPDAG